MWRGHVKKQKFEIHGGKARARGFDRRPSKALGRGDGRALARVRAAAVCSPFMGVGRGGGAGRSSRYAAMACASSDGGGASAAAGGRGGWWCEGRARRS